MKFSILYFFILCFFVSSCSNNKQDSTKAAVNSDKTDYIEENSNKSFIPQDTTDEYETRRIKDGSYTADITYYNTATGANTLYVTKVHIENNYLKDIKWPNGVWLADQLFKPERIKKDGTCTISNLEKGYENRVKILDLEYY